MLPLMTTAQIFFSFVAAALVLAGGWVYFRGGPFRLYASMALITSGAFIEKILRGENPTYILFWWCLAIFLLKVHFVNEKGKLESKAQAENE